MKGYIQVYTGNGKGKTTAALGLALRAAGAGLTVLVAQFLKQGEYSEITALKSFHGRITVRQYGCGKFVRGMPSEEEKQAASHGLNEIRSCIQNRSYDMIVVEEGNVAVSCGLIRENDLLDLMEMKPEGLELVITGRGATEKVTEKADLVTEMKEVKHYFKKGVTARKGIEK
ncbi:MAG: cob(I)yrinic acid a,c-diamide adenosyltransferase [Desulfarculaceae bacterium]|nr:cob(I)yrinic acid a,c-diamide adenosyltransferase [Desulfarculaceae bacterium]